MSGKRQSDIALNYTILGNYKNVSVTGKSAYFAKKEKKKRKKNVNVQIYIKGIVF